MSFLSITIPASLLLAAVLLWIVVRAVRAGDFDDWEGPAARHWLDDDACPERPEVRDERPEVRDERPEVRDVEAEASGARPPDAPGA